MITEFLDADGNSSHDRFQAWRTEHQNGVFLTLESRTRANLHGTRCQHLGSGPPYFTSNDGFGSLTSKRKLCAPEPELLKWANENDISVKRCHHCLRDELIGAERAISEEPADWQRQLRLWATPIAGAPAGFQGSVETFFRRAFESTRCPNDAWFGVHTQIASLVVGGIFLAALTRSTRSRWLWLLVDGNVPKLPGITYQPVKSTRTSKYPLRWAHATTLEAVSVVAGSDTIWESFASASEKILSSAIGRERDSVQQSAERLACPTSGSSRITHHFLQVLNPIPPIFQRNWSALRAPRFADSRLIVAVNGNCGRQRSLRLSDRAVFDAKFLAVTSTLSSGTALLAEVTLKFTTSGLCRIVTKTH